MKAIALYIGYAVLTAVGLGLLVKSFGYLWRSIMDCRRIIHTKHTVRFMQKPLNRTLLDGVDAALGLLHELGFQDRHTLYEIKTKADRFRKLHHISRNKCNDSKPKKK